MKVLQRHATYSDYVSKQKSKTTNPEKIEKWTNAEWKSKIEGFKSVFARNEKYVSQCKTAICLGSRTGQEVVALKDLGLKAIGIDLVAFPPHTEVGDIHDIGYPDKSFDLAFTNVFDHSIYPDKFVSEIERICKKYAILNLQIGVSGDEYSENSVDKPDDVSSLFKSFRVLESREVKRQFDGMNYELVMG